MARNRRHSVFGCNKDPTKHREAIDSLWKRIDGPILLAAGDVLYQLANSRWRSLRDREQGIDLIMLFPYEVRRVAEACLNHEGSCQALVAPTSSSTNNWILARWVDAATTEGPSIPRRTVG